MAGERTVDPRLLKYDIPVAVLLEKRGPFVVVNSEIALRYRSNGGAELEVTAGFDKLILDRTRLGDEEVVEELLSHPPGNPRIIGSLPCRFDRDAEDRTAYVGTYRLQLIGEGGGFQMGLWVATQGPISTQPYSRNQEPKTILRRLMNGERVGSRR